MAVNGKKLDKRRSIAVPSYIIREAQCSIYILKKSLLQTNQAYYIDLKNFLLKCSISIKYYFLKNFIQLRNTFFFFLPNVNWSKNKYYFISDYIKKFYLENQNLNYFIFKKSLFKFSKLNLIKIPGKPFGLTYFFDKKDVDFNENFLQNNKVFYENYKDFLDNKSWSYCNFLGYTNSDNQLNVNEINFNIFNTFTKMYILEIYKNFVFIILNSIIIIYF